MASKKLEWLKATSMVVGSAATAAKALLDYRKFRHHQEKLEYTRNLQRKAWEQVMHGELSEAKIDDMTIKAPKSTKKRATPRSPAKDVSVEGGAAAEDDGPTNGKEDGVLATPVGGPDEMSDEPESDQKDPPQDVV